MPVILKTEAVELSTYAVRASFYDEDDNLVVPNSITWTLSDANGTIINSRSEQVVAPASTITIVLSGNDLKILDNETGAAARILTIEAVYDSNLGSNLPFKDEATFSVLDLKAIEGGDT